MSLIIKFLKEYKETYLKYLGIFILLVILMGFIFYYFSQPEFYLRCEKSPNSNDTICNYKTNTTKNDGNHTIILKEITQAEYSINYMSSKGCILLTTSKEVIPLACETYFKKRKPTYLLNEINAFISNKTKNKLDISYNPSGNCFIFYSFVFVIVYFIQLFRSLKTDIQDFKSDHEEESSAYYDYKQDEISFGGDVNDLIDKGYNLIEVRSYKNAERIFKSALSMDPNNCLALYYLAYCNYKENKSGKAIKILKLVISLEPHNYDAFLLLSEVYGTIRINYKKAINYALKAIEIRPLSASAHAWLAQMYCFSNKLKLCYEHAHEALKINPNLHIAYLALGLYYDSRKKFKLSKENYHKALELSPNSDVTMNNLAALCINNGHYKEAFHLMREAILIDPQKELFQRNFKIAYIRSHPLLQPLEWLGFNKYRWVYITIFILSASMPILICISGPMLLLALYSGIVTMGLKAHYESALKNGTLSKIIDSN